MRAIALAWRISKPWMRVSAIIFLLIVGNGLLGIFMPATPEPARAASTVPEHKPDPKPSAINNCRGAIEGIAMNPSSVSYHSFTAPPNVREMPDGRLEVFLKFSAKNAYGSEAASIARCVMSGDGKTLSEITAQPSR